jgi:hypothetical protein
MCIDGTNHCIEPGAIATTGQDANALYRHVTQLPID